MIEFRNITKKFKKNFWEKEFLAVNNVSFKISNGDLVGFLGANGAGKTTLIKILMDFSRQSEGVVIFSSNLGMNSKEIRSNIGYLPERAYLYPHLTGREFLNYVSNLNELDLKVTEERMNYWGVKLNIDHAFDKLTKEYSKGMLQRLGFLSCLIHSPKFLILDEPLSGLDPVGRRDFKKILQELNQEGVTIFFSSHIVSDVEEICNKVIFIEKGCLVYEGNIDTLLLQHANDNYKVRILKNKNIETYLFNKNEKDQFLKTVNHEEVEILEIEKDKIKLEEIIYKIK